MHFMDSPSTGSRETFSSTDATHLKQLIAQTFGSQVAGSTSTQTYLMQAVPFDQLTEGVINAYLEKKSGELHALTTENHSLKRVQAQHGKGVKALQEQVQAL